MSKTLAAFQSGDYKQVLKAREVPSTDLERYALIRAAILLGEYDRAGRKLSLADWEAPFYSHFLKCQLDIYRRRELEEKLDELLALTAEFPESCDLIRGEYHFVFGHLCHLLDQSLSGGRHHRLACEYYLAAKCSVAAAHALYNLSITYKHLNQRREFEETRVRLAELCKESSLARIPFLRLEINLAMDFEEFERGLDLLAEFEGLVRESGRIRDLGSATCQRIYALMCLNRDDEAMALCDRDVPTHAAVIAEYRNLISLPLMTAEQARRLAKRWSHLESVFRLGLLRLLLNRLVRSEEYLCVITIAKAARRLSQSKQQAPSLVDHQYYEILALAKLGRDASAKSLLAIYRNQALNWEATGRLRKAESLERLLSLTQAPTLELNPARREATFSGVKHDLSKKPMLLKLLVAVADARKLPLETLHERLYGREYDPLRDERKLHSLLDRARRDLGLGARLQRQEGNIQLDSEIEVRTTRELSRDIRAESRREVLAQRVRRSPVPITISDLEESLEFSRRTLQLDLKQLARE